MNKHFSKTDYISLAIFIILLIGSIIAYNQDKSIMSYLFDQNLSYNYKLGKISKINNDVRTKLLNETSWKIQDQADFVHHRQMIYTGKDSSTEISLKNGSVIKMEPESLILLLREGSSEILEIKKGSLVGQFKNIKVLHKGKMITPLKGTKRIETSQRKIIFSDSKNKTLKQPSTIISLKEDTDNKISLNSLESKVFVLDDNTIKIQLKWDSKVNGPFNAYIEKKKGNNRQVKEIKGIEANEYQYQFKDIASYSIYITDSSKVYESNTIDFEIIELPKVQIKNKYIKKQY